MNKRNGVCLYFMFIFLSDSVIGEKFHVAFEWNYINYTWPSEDALASSSYIPGEDIIAGIKIYKDIVYLALPRGKESARVTLATIPIDTNQTLNPLLSPFPNWEMNSGSSCDTFQNVQSMEIDKDGIMWVLDGRRIDNNTECPPKITLLDLNKNGNKILDFIVPKELCSDLCFLNDLVIDGDFAYISDTTQSDPGITIYNRKTNKAWKARDQTMFGDPDAINFTAQGVENTSPIDINGIALSPACSGNNANNNKQEQDENERIFYYMPLTSFNMFSISTVILKNESLATGNISEFITNRGTKQGQSGGMICDTNNDIYYGILPMDAVGKWHTENPLNDSEVVEQNHKIIKWPDSFSIYKQNLYLITNSLLKFNADIINLNEINFRIIKLRTNTQSYIYCENQL